MSNIGGTFNDLISAGVSEETAAAIEEYNRMVQENPMLTVPKP